VTLAAATVKFVDSVPRRSTLTLRWTSAATDHRRTVGYEWYNDPLRVGTAGFTNVTALLDINDGICGAGTLALTSSLFYLSAVQRCPSSEIFSQVRFVVE